MCIRDRGTGWDEDRAVAATEKEKRKTAWWMLRSAARNSARVRVEYITQRVASAAARGHCTAAIYTDELQTPRERLRAVHRCAVHRRSTGTLHWRKMSRGGFLGIGCIGKIHPRGRVSHKILQRHACYGIAKFPYASFCVIMFRKIIEVGKHQTNKIDIVRQCEHFLKFELVSVSTANRAAKFQVLFHVHIMVIFHVCAFLFFSV